MNFLKNINFSKDTINIFIINLKSLEAYLPKLLTYLSDKEKIQARAFLLKHLKDHYIASHGILRILLGKYLSCAPSQVEYLYNEFQKPLCKNNQNLYFNMSHSHEYACYAFCLNYPIGIDIEYLNSKIEINDLLPIITTQAEFFIFDTLKENDKFYLFYKMWTTKEAFLKALGFGLSYPLSSIETTILPREKFKVTQYHNINETEIDREWTFFSLNFLPRYLGTVAVKKKTSYINMINLDALKFF